MLYDCRGFWLGDFPIPDDDFLSSFGRLPLDIYTEGGQRYRRFTAYRMGWQTNGWSFEALPPRPFLQPKLHNVLTGGVAREFEPLEIDPSEQLAFVASRLGLATYSDYALNVHQVRIITNLTTKGVTVPEGQDLALAANTTSIFLLDARRSYHRPTATAYLHPSRGRTERGGAVTRGVR